MKGANSTMRGRFICQNPQKYLGNANNIFFRSSWEFAFMKWLDQNPAVLKFGSEELIIPYVSPLDNRVHRYFPDIIVLYKHKDGSVRKEIVEIKPYSQTVPTPKMTDRDKMALVVNQAKWAAASAYANQMGAHFRVVTEKTLWGGINKRKPPAPGNAV